MYKKSIAIFGSTGAVGSKTVKIVRSNLKQYDVKLLTANENFELLAKQAIAVKAKKVVIGNEKHFQLLKSLLSNHDIEIFYGTNLLIECAKINVDISIMAIVGIAALFPTIQSIKSAKILAIASKEVLVCAGKIISNMAPKAQIIPLDSEHNAIFQIYDKEINRITLTASGGPFYFANKKKSIDEVIKHPVWNMGKKISVDSATMMNKVLEVIEAHYLFDIPVDNINILVHPEAIMHGIVSYIDGNSISVLSLPDMEISISYALSWPNRSISAPSKELNLTEVGKLSFYEPDYNRFPALKFIKANNYVVLNAANEMAVKFFLQGKISFENIVVMIDKIMESISEKQGSTVEEIFEQDKRTRLSAEEVLLYLS